MERETIIGYELQEDLEGLVYVGRKACQICGFKNPAECPYYLQLHKRIIVKSFEDDIKDNLKKRYKVVTQGLGSICLECSDFSWALNLVLEEYKDISQRTLESANEECNIMNSKEKARLRTVRYDPAIDKPPLNGIIS